LIFSILSKSKKSEIKKDIEYKNGVSTGWKVNLMSREQSTITHAEEFNFARSMFGEFETANPKIKIEVGGHTDNTGDQIKNTSLSAKRALAVKTYLVTAGIDTNRLTTKGYADAQAIADNKTLDGRAQNRRTEIKIMP
jgi:flagellar motor protein MotB